MHLLIHDLTPAEWERIADIYKDWTVISDNGSIRPCIGCFHCWTSGTGTCIFKDGYENMGALIHEADKMVVMSRYTYGGFSPFVKNVFDRSIGYVLPEFETAYGEMHHQKRYPGDRSVTFRFRGSGLSEADKEKARQYVASVCRNLRGSVKEVIFDDTADTADEAAAENQPAAAPAHAHALHGSADRTESRAGILLIDGSLRGWQSNTAVFLERLQKELPLPAEVLSLSGGTDPEKITEAVGRAATVVLGIPLYVDGAPASVLRLMESVKNKNSGTGCRLYALMNNGLYESRQNVNLLNMVKAFCADCGIEYCGALAIGAGEVAGTLMRGTKHPLWPVRNVLSGIARLSKAITGDKETDDIFADPFLFPRWLYILIANTNWQMLKKKSR